MQKLISEKRNYFFADSVVTFLRAGAEYDDFFLSEQTFFTHGFLHELPLTDLTLDFLVVTDLVVAGVLCFAETEEESFVFTARGGVGIITGLLTVVLSAARMMRTFCAMSNCAEAEKSAMERRTDLMVIWSGQKSL